MKITENNNVLINAVEQTSPVGVWSLDCRTKQLHWSDNTKKLHEVDLTYIPNLSDAIGFYAPEFRSKLNQKIEAAIKYHEPLALTARIHTAQRKTKWIKVYGQVNPEGTVLCGAVRDVTDEVLLDQKMHSLMESQARVRNHIVEAILDYDSSGTIVRANVSANQLFLDGDSLIGSTVGDLVTENLDFCGLCSTEKEHNIEVMGRKRSGEEFPAQLTISSTKDASTCTAIFRDLFEQKKTAEYIERLKYCDALSGLPNRHYLLNFLSEVQPTGQSLIAVNIKNFSKINVACGHHEGDQVLLAFSQQLSSIGNGEHTVVKDLADRFFILQSKDDADKEPSSSRLLQAILDLEDIPISGFAHNHYLSLSLGISQYLPDVTPSHLIARSESALMHHRYGSSSSFHVYQTSDTALIKRHYLIEQELREAIDKKHITYWLQPKVNPSHDIVAAELLVRWVDEKGSIPYTPAEFIPIAESTGQISTLGLDAFKHAAVYLSQLRRFAPEMKLSVNVSPKQFMDSGFVNQIEQMFSEYNVPLSHLIVEITEGLLLEDNEQVLNVIKNLKKLGVKLSIDDFGTGYSNLKRILELHVDELKVDKSLIIPLPESDRSMALVTSIVQMSQNLNISVTAEGVESLDAAQRCTSIGVDHLQGYYFYKPVPFGDFLSLINNAE